MQALYSPFSLVKIWFLSESTMRCFVLLLFLEGCLCCFGDPLALDAFPLLGWKGFCILISCQISNTYAGLQHHVTVEDDADSILYTGSPTAESYTIAIQPQGVPKGVELRADPGTTVREGQKLSLECIVKISNPDVLEYQWWRNHHLMAKKIENKMEIDPVGRQHPGLYRCTAGNILGTTESEKLNITVQYRPKQTRAPFVRRTIKEKDAITLHCSFIANPPITKYEWYKNHASNIISTQKELHFQSIHHSDSGTYYCKAYNLIGVSTSSNVTLDVLYVPKEVELSADPGTTIREGERLSLVCTPKSSNLTVGYQWWQNNHTIGQGINWSRMEIHAVERKHSGRYRCDVTNILGTMTSEELTIDVQYPPEEPKVAFSRITNQGEDTVTLQCWSTANPPITHYEWYKCPALDVISSQIELRFLATQPNNSGHYYCKAYNPIGQSTSSVLTLNID